MDTAYCAVCGREVRQPVRYLVNWDCERNEAIAPHAQTGGSGWLPVGSECVKRLPTGYVYRSPRENRKER